MYKKGSCSTGALSFYSRYLAWVVHRVEGGRASFGVEVHVSVAKWSLNLKFRGVFQFISQGGGDFFPRRKGAAIVSSGVMCVKCQLDFETSGAFSTSYPVQNFYTKKRT